MLKTTIVKDGYPIIAVFLFFGIITAFYAGLSWSTIPFGIAIFLMFFFRNPERVIVNDDNIILAPADGTVMSVTDIYDEEYLQAPATKVVIFLSVFNVHINRSPINGEIKYQRYTCGGFKPAYKKAASYENERHAVGIENKNIKILV